jgi:hypothetical protein
MCGFEETVKSTDIIFMVRGTGMMKQTKLDTIPNQTGQQTRQHDVIKQTNGARNPRSLARDQLSWLGLQSSIALDRRRLQVRIMSVLNSSPPLLPQRDGGP